MGASSVLFIVPFDAHSDLQKVDSTASISAAVSGCNEDLALLFDQNVLANSARESTHHCTLCEQLNPPALKDRIPNGVVVAIICNLQDVSLWSLAQQIALEFRSAFQLAHLSKTLN